MKINGVIYESRGIDHQDDRRDLMTVFNGDLGDFVAQQVKILELKKNSELGGHFHDYAELFYMLKGEGSFILQDPSTKIIEMYNMVKGDRLFVPRGIAHKAEMKRDSILVGCSEQAYISPEKNDIKYEF